MLGVSFRTNSKLLNKRISRLIGNAVNVLLNERASKKISNLITEELKRKLKSI